MVKDSDIYVALLDTGELETFHKFLDENISPKPPFKEGYKYIGVGVLVRYQGQPTPRATKRYYFYKNVLTV